jgi:hypothetical protein
MCHPRDTQREHLCREPSHLRAVTVVPTFSLKIAYTCVRVCLEQRSDRFHMATSRSVYQRRSALQSRKSISTYQVVMYALLSSFPVLVTLIFCPYFTTTFQLVLCCVIVMHKNLCVEMISTCHLLPENQSHLDAPEDPEGIVP